MFLWEVVGRWFSEVIFVGYLLIFVFLLFYFCDGLTFNDLRFYKPPTDAVLGLLFWFLGGIFFGSVFG